MTLEDLSQSLFSLGIILTAVLLPLDLYTMGITPLEILAIALLAQRPFFIWAKSPKFKFPFTRKYSLWLALPALGILASTLPALNHHIALHSWLLFVSLLGRAWIIACCAEKDDVKLFEKTTLGVAAAVIAFGYYQFVADVLRVPIAYTLLLARYSSQFAFPFPRVHSTALEPLYFANYLFLPIGLMIFRLKKSVNLRLIAGLSLTLALFLSTNSRSAFAGLVVAGAILGVVRLHNRTILKQLGLIALLSAGLLFGLVSMPRWAPVLLRQGGGTNVAVTSFAQHVTDIGDESSKTRYQLWPKALRLFVHRPLLGVGPDNSRFALYPAEIAKGTNYVDLQPINNDYIQLLAELGLIGLLTFVPLGLGLVRLSWQTIKSSFVHPASPYVFALIGTAVQANSFGALALLRTWVVIGFLLAAWRLYKAPRALPRS